MGFSAEEQDGQVLVTVWRQADDRGLYKAYVRGADGRFLLGTLAMEQGRLAITRRVALRRLIACGAWPILSADTPLEFSFPKETLPEGWRRVEAPLPLCDGLLRTLTGDAPGGWMRWAPGGFSVAYPWELSRPFPLTPLFCFADVETFGGGLRAVYSFTTDGVPIAPRTEQRKKP